MNNKTFQNAMLHISTMSLCDFAAPAPWLVLLEQVVPMIDLLSPDLVPGTPAHVPATARISAADKMTKF